jgi:hypothetical protein
MIRSTIICSAVVGPRCPLKMDPDLDYEVDSDDEWEEVLVDIHVSFLSLLRYSCFVFYIGGSW